MSGHPIRHSKLMQTERKTVTGINIKKYNAWCNLSVECYVASKLNEPNWMENGDTFWYPSCYKHCLTIVKCHMFSIPFPLSQNALECRSLHSKTENFPRVIPADPCLKEKGKDGWEGVFIFSCCSGCR
jgi:hypothetical protein